MGFNIDAWNAGYYKKRLEEATKLLQEAVDKYPVEEDQNLWTSRVRKWLKND